MEASIVRNARPSNVPGRISCAWVLRNTRMPISVIFETLEYGSGIQEIMKNYNLTREQMQTLLEFAARSAGSSRRARHG